MEKRKRNWRRRKKKKKYNIFKKNYNDNVSNRNC